MKGKYIIVLFKNKVRYKIIKNYQTFKKSKEFFDGLIKKNDDVVFDIQTENGKSVKYELALITKDNSNNIQLFKQDEIGRNIKIEIDEPDYKILEIKNYKLPEKIKKINKKEKIDSNVLVDSICKGKTLKMISKLNNKIIVQEELDYKIYSLKSEYDANRFLENLQTFLISKGNKNCLVVKDSSREQKKYMYDILEGLGYDKNMLYRKHTTYSKDI